MDDTPVEEMRRRRMERISSDQRDKPVAVNVAEFQELLKGTERGQALVVRAKIDFASSNASLRDPVLYRSNVDVPHARTKGKYKAYPTYDLACPIVDSIEGVTHALRDSSYSDRKAQFDWVQEKLGLRRVHIRNFSRINFKRTLMSKRKLKHLVDTKFVDGWDDPRFPTIKGVLRRGMSVDTLKNFMLAQAGSKKQVDMEWDKFWSDNAKIIDKTAARYMAVSSSGSVVLKISNFTGNGVLKIAKHPKDKGGQRFGHKVVYTSNRVWVERDDVQGEAYGELVEGELIALMRWSVVEITKVERDAAGDVTSLEGSLVHKGDFRLCKRKISWVADTPHALKIRATEYDHLVTKNVEPSENFLDFLNERSVATTTMMGNAAMVGLAHGEIVQIERRGFYRVDAPATQAEDDRELALVLVPDGKLSAMSTLSSRLEHR